MPKGRVPTLFVSPGQRLGRGIVTDPDIRIARTPARPNGLRGARLLCDCGTTYEAPIPSLTRADQGRRAVSCGCLQRERAIAWCKSERKRALTSELNRERKLTHGLSRHQLYNTWWKMLERCTNPDCKSWVYYGARGITVCPEWHDVAAFIGWIEANLGPRPSRMSLDRIDNDGNYEPGNVRWATQSEQIRNSRRWPRR